MTTSLNHNGNRNYPISIRREFLIIIAILILGLYLRLFMVSLTEMKTPFGPDALQYTSYAYNIRLHGVYSKDVNGLKHIDREPTPDALRSPGYPLFLYPFTVTNHLSRFTKNVFFVQAVLSTFTILITYFLARFMLSLPAAFIATILTAISPHLITANNYILTETLFSFFLMTGLLLLANSMGSNKPKTLILAGCLLGYATLIRPTLQYFSIFFLCYLFMDDTLKRKKRIALLFTIPFFAMISLWFFYNYVSMGILSDNTLSIATLQHGMYPWFLYNNDPNSFGFPYRFDPATNEITRSLDSVSTAIMSRFASEPREHILWFLSKPFYFFRWRLVQGVDIFVYPVLSSPYEDMILFKSTYLIMRWLHPVIVALSCMGMIIAWLPKRVMDAYCHHPVALRILSLTYIYFILVHVAGAPFPRYSIPIRPITYILGMATLHILILVSFKTKWMTKWIKKES